MDPCTCQGAWETYSGHRLDCPRNAEVGRMRARIEQEKRDDFEESRRGRWIAGSFVHEDDIPSASEL